MPGKRMKVGDLPVLPFTKKLYTQSDVYADKIKKKMV